MMDERVDQRDLAAGIMSLVVKGYFTVELTEEGTFFKSKAYHLHPTAKTDTTGLSLFEQDLFSHLRACGDPITKEDMRTTVAPHVMGLKNQIYEDFVTRGLYHGNPNAVRVRASLLFAGWRSLGGSGWRAVRVDPCDQLWLAHASADAVWQPGAARDAGLL